MEFFWIILDSESFHLNIISSLFSLLYWKYYFHKLYYYPILFPVLGSRVDIGDVDSLTPLHLACNRGHLDVVEVLLTSGAMVNSKTTDKLSALHYAASRGFTDIVEVLLSHGANIDSLDATDRTPLKLAVSRNLYDVAKVLVRHEARVNLEDVKGLCVYNASHLNFLFLCIVGRIFISRKILTKRMLS